MQHEAMRLTAVCTPSEQAGKDHADIGAARKLRGVKLHPFLASTIRIKKPNSLLGAHHFHAVVEMAAAKAWIGLNGR